MKCTGFPDPDDEHTSSRVLFNPMSEYINRHGEDDLQSSFDEFKKKHGYKYKDEHEHRHRLKLLPITIKNEIQGKNENYFFFAFLTTDSSAGWGLWDGNVCVCVCVCPRAKKSNVSYLTPSSIWSKYGETDVKITFKYNVSRSSSYRHCKVAFFWCNLLYKFQRFLPTYSKITIMK